MKNQDRMRSLSTSNKQTPEQTPVEAFSGPTSPTEEEDWSPRTGTHTGMWWPCFFAPHMCVLLPPGSHCLKLYSFVNLEIGHCEDLLLSSYLKMILPIPDPSVTGGFSPACRFQNDHSEA